MPARTLDPPQLRPGRPKLERNKSSYSVQSNSVPTTPQQYPSKLTFGSRSPSPDGDPNHSPRSAHSESNSVLPSLRRPLVGCKFETGMAFSRRRMAYSLGGDKLDKAKGAVKRSLRPAEEQKLSDDMRELYNRLIPASESERRRAMFVQKLERLLNDQWPGHEIRARVFGSSGNLLCTSDSDVDICITTPMKRLEKVCLLANALAEHGMERVVCVSTAKVPIVKIWDPELEIACDMNVNNTLALENTRMIKLYVQIDERVRSLAMILKYWTKRRILNDAALGGTLSSYTWICMIINFLQTRDPPVLPALHQRPHQKRGATSGDESSFADDLDSLRGFGAANKETLGELLFHFFRYYGHEVDYETQVVSVRQGKLISKEEKGWHLMQNNRLCVEEPFNIGRNLGNTADDTSVRGLHMELRRAFTLIADQVNLAACCEQYVFPPEEERIWEKPPPQPRPILSRSASQTGRTRGGNPNSRGGRYMSARNNNSNRRASSGAAFSHAQSNVLPQPQLGMSPQDYWHQTQQAQALHHNLYNSYQFLQAQAAELRFQQAQNQAQAQAQAMARSQSRSEADVSQPLSPFVGGMTNGSHDHAPLTAPLRAEMFFYPHQFSNAPRDVQHSTNTTPSSPALPAATPELRRSAQRSHVTGESSTGSHRSHSQPARSVPAPLVLNGISPSNFGARMMSQLANMRQTPAYTPTGMANGALDRLARQSQSLHLGDSPPDDLTPKEYLGYYVGGVPSDTLYAAQSSLSPMPVFGDLTDHSRRTSPDLNPAGLGLSLRPDSLSQSPAMGMETMDGSPHSASRSVSGAQSVSDRSVVNRGPLIVDGSSSTTQGDLSQPSGTNDRISSPRGRHSDTTSTAPEFPSQEAFSVHEADQALDAGFTSPLRQPGQPHRPPKLVAHAVSGIALGDISPVAPSSGSVPTFPTPADPSRQRNVTLLSGNGLQGQLSPERISPTPMRREAKGESGISTGAIPNLDLSSDTSEMHREGAVSAVPFLSPVLETRTPSPSKNKRSEVVEQPRLNGVDKPVRLINGTEPQPPPTPATMLDSRISAGASMPKPNGYSAGPVKENHSTSAQTNGWQKTGSKNAKKAKSAAKRNSGSNRGQIDLAAADVMERKGG
ncbi:MAG: hypothetical protein M1817_000904 [Caeruleum heppii]|nr:MAG: hypothetical protein M1817_000904 [Caeruleum heppii]